MIGKQTQQGLKPILICGIRGTTEVVPCYKACQILTFTTVC